MRKIDSLRFIRLCGLYTPEAEEFTHEQMDNMISYAKSLQEKYGNFNLRTDSPKGSDKISMNHPFVKFCSIEKLKEIVAQNKEKLSYIIHQPIDDTKIICLAQFCRRYDWRSAHLLPQILMVFPSTARAPSIIASDSVG